MSGNKFYSVIHESCPRLHFCERFDELSPLWNFSRHSHPYIELMYFLDGKGKLEVSGQTISISLFDTVIYPANWPHQEAQSAERKREVLCLQIDLPELHLDEPILLHDEQEQLRTLFFNIYDEAKREEPEPLLIEYGIKTLLTRILRDRSENRLKVSFLSGVLQYIHGNFNRKMSLDELAQIEHVSKSYLCRQFKQQTGMTVVSYIQNLRIETAKGKLLAEDRSIEEISYEVGFDSPKYFLPSEK